MGDSTQERYQAEAEERWGKTEQYRQSAKRTAAYTEADWTAIKAELESIEADFAAAMAEDTAPDDPRAMDVAERARLHIDRRYYTCSHAMHEALAEMYTADERFRMHYDARKNGLADYVAAAIRANGARQPSGDGGSA